MSFKIVEAWNFSQFKSNKKIGRLLSLVSEDERVYSLLIQNATGPQWEICRLFRQGSDWNVKNGKN